ncbi:thioredoxin family protein [Vaginisenegalia massiliensis]|uniref:thioredoxin family protein n=1 Tax=Vaginisenegalia massiliensis TaxID=2058294 RepID=UPI000F53BB58|nr:thioredoxin family protein [Vaginisenegalia massiliensis]
MQVIDDLALIEEAKRTQSLFVILVTQDSCGVCHAIEGPLSAILADKEIPAFQIKANNLPQVASYLEVLTVPVVLIFQYDREIHRQARFIDLMRIERLLTQVAQ